MRSSANSLDIVVIHDKGATLNQKLEDVVKQKLIERKRVLDYSMFAPGTPSEADLEDDPPVLYIAAFNATYGKDLNGNVLAATDLGTHPRITARIDKWLVDKKLALLKDGGFNHYRVAQTALPMMTEAAMASSLPQFEQLFSRVKSAL